MVGKTSSAISGTIKEKHVNHFGLERVYGALGMGSHQISGKGAVITSAKSIRGQL